MSLTLTLGLLSACLIVGGVGAWRGALPPDLVRGPRMIPWRFLMVASAALAFLLLIHLVGLLTGQADAPPTY